MHWWIQEVFKIISMWNWKNTDQTQFPRAKMVSEETPCPSSGLLRDSGCRVPRKRTNYGNPAHWPNVTFTFEVNSVCACICLCADIDPLGKSLMLGPSALCANTSYFAYEKQRCSAEVPKISQKCLWKCHKGISWMSEGLWEMGSATSQPSLSRVGRIYGHGCTALTGGTLNVLWPAAIWGSGMERSADHITN